MTDLPRQLRTKTVWTLTRCCLFAALFGSMGRTPAQDVLRIHAGGADQDRLGAALGGRADVDGDGVPDLAVGSPGHAGGAGADQGRAQVFSGATGSSIFLQLGTAAGDRFGSSVSLTGDVDNDGRADIAVGAPFANAGAGAEQGQVVIYSGATAGVLLTISGTAAGDRFGTSVALLADLNSDGLGEIAVGAPLFDGTAGADTGRVTIHSGLDGSVLFTIEGGNAGDLLGSSLAPAGDVDADGLADVVAGAPSFDGTAGADTGRVVVLSGATGSVLIATEGTQASAELGTSVAGDFDANNDLRPDVAAGAPRFDGVAGADAGLVVVISGRTGATLWTREGTAADARLGTAVGTGGDVNGDGFSDVLAGAPLFDGTAGADTGRTAVLSGWDGTELFAHEGTSASDQEGGAVAGVGDLDSDGRLDFATGAPESAQGGTARGIATVVLGGTAAVTEVRAFATAAQPTAVTACDADGDGDQDIVVVHGGTLSILWNGDQLGSVPFAELGNVARTDISLSLGASAECVAAGQWDGDAACEFVVGRSDGSVDLIDGTGGGVTAAFALTGASPFQVDTSASPGAISAVAFYGSGASSSLIVCGTGSLVVSGFLEKLDTPGSTPTLSGPLATGGTFASVVVGDLDGDTQLDVVAVNSATSSAGGVHVHLGPGLGAATGSPYPTPVPAIDVTVLDLDGDSIRDDVAIASLSFTGGGVRVLPNYVPNVGFAAPVDPGLTLARAVDRGNFDVTSGDDLCALDGAGRLVLLEGFNGTAFASSTLIPTSTAPGTSLAVAQLTVGAPGLCDPDEVTVAYLSQDLLTTWRSRRLADVRLVAGTGCPTSAPISVVSISQDPLIGDTTMTVDLTGASPWSLAFLSAQENLPVGGTPTVMTTVGCGIAASTGTIIQLFTFTDVLGSAQIAAGLPNDPCLIGDEILLQWGVLDGGPILGAITASDAIVIRIGER